MTAALLFLASALAVALAAVAVLAHRAGRVRARLDDAERRLAAAIHARDAFFDLATHELRSPLAAILGYQELLADGAYGEMQPAATEPIARLGRAAQHLLHLIDGVVELSRLRAGGVRPDLEPVNTGVLLSAVADAFRTHARDRGLEPRIDLPPSLPTITSDPDRLLRALDLLVTSAIKHPAGPAIHMDARSDGTDLHLLIHPTEITIRDPADDPELRLGIRIAIAARVATLLGGDLHLDSDPGSPVIRALRFHVRDLAADTPGRNSPGPFDGSGAVR
ncbi:MAG TPA: HAMP domain-containing sensor histidine kinase [Longimicrobiales bacterium]|nr:HAMP domain-containing sensor histidine kinase [Longimicrobiales bacterium]